MTNTVKLEFGFNGWKKRLNVAWQVIRTGGVTIIMSEDDFGESVMGLYDCEIKEGVQKDEGLQ